MIQVVRGTPSELHALDPFDAAAGAATVHGLEVWRCEPISSAIVLGSRQADDVVDPAACRRAGFDVAKRRSGGGAVLVVPGDMVWIDVVAARGWLPDDVRRSMILVGECWRLALIDEGGIDEGGIDEGGIDHGVGEQRDVDGDPDELVVHRGGMVSSEWSALICFAGLGPGEVVQRDLKLVGLSQRRTRAGVRIQGLLHRRSDVRSMRALFAVDVPPEELVEPASRPTVDAVRLAEHLARRLTERLSP